MANNFKTLYSKKIGGGKDKSFFVDVRESDKGAKYLQISESKKRDEQWETTRIMLFPDKAAELIGALEEAKEFLEDGQRIPREDPF